MAQAETTKDVEESRQISKSIFLTTLQDIRKFLSSTLLDPKIKITEIEENIIQTSITLFLQKESNWYYMHLENLFDINLLHIFCKKIRKNLPTPVSLDNSAPSLYSLLCELSLILYKYEMLNQNTKNDISPVIINYIPDSSHNTSSYNGYYTEWLNIPIEISTRSSCKAVNKIKNTEKKLLLSLRISQNKMQKFAQNLNKEDKNLYKNSQRNIMNSNKLSLQALMVSQILMKPSQKKRKKKKTSSLLFVFALVD